MDELRKSVKKSEQLRIRLAELRMDKSLEGMILYNKTLLEATERQHNIYTRLRLLGDRESVQIADEMEHVAEQYMGKSLETPFDSFIRGMKKEIIWQLNMLTAGEYGSQEDPG